MSLLWNKDLIFKSPAVYDADFPSEDNFPDEKISVRESTSELHISVGDKIFVFGKAKGTLDKVKVGMHVLPFEQVPGAQGNESTFTKVAWKKLKDSSIQIQSSYSPWPSTLVWTVFSNGDLKMEALGPSQDMTENRWMGLGFKYPEHQLYQVSWLGNRSDTTSNRGQWKNENFSAISDSGLKKIKTQGKVFQPFQSVKFEFESITLEVRTENPDVYLKLGQAENQDANNPRINTDLKFLFRQALTETDHLPQTTSDIKNGNKSISLNTLVLWFHFQ